MKWWNKLWRKKPTPSSEEPAPKPEPDMKVMEAVFSHCDSCKGNHLRFFGYEAIEDTSGRVLIGMECPDCQAITVIPAPLKGLGIMRRVMKKQRKRMLADAMHLATMDEFGLTTQHFMRGESE